MHWHGHLDLAYRIDHASGAARCIVADRHDGPLRVLAALHPEAPTVCHSVLVHPPGGMAGGDRLDLNITLDERAHALITTPGATRFYRSAGEPAAQSVHARLAAGARLEWLPLETLVYSAALAESRCVFELATGAEMIGRDVIALGLPAAAQPFERGHFSQHIEVPGVWLERGVLAATDARLSTRRSAWPAGACWPRSGSRRATRSQPTGARPCWMRRAASRRPQTTPHC